MFLKVLLIGAGLTLRLSFNFSSSKHAPIYFDKAQSTPNAYRRAAAQPDGKFSEQA
ncbi:MAG: hypothetical protein LBF67_06150 [Prevotellaceae bacterium]|jgi:hypothetical protein|nr:hypothetical protein [Prevotellaceae bacterium]